MERRKFHVYVIESPSPIDLYKSRFEGNSLKETLKMSGIPSSYRLTVNKEAFNAAFLVGMKEYLERSKTLPIIHISAHGNKDGLQLTDGQIVAWDELKELLCPVNRALKGLLIVSMSSCEGFNGTRMAMDDDDFPFLAIIGNDANPTWSETNIGYSTFYHLFAKGEDPARAVEAMRIASGNKDFYLDLAIRARERYLAALKKYIKPLNQSIAVSTITEAIPKKNDTIEKALG